MWRFVTNPTSAKKVRAALSYLHPRFSEEPEEDAEEERIDISLQNLREAIRRSRRELQETREGLHAPSDGSCQDFLKLLNQFAAESSE